MSTRYDDRTAHVAALLSAAALIAPGCGFDMLPPIFEQAPPDATECDSIWCAPDGTPEGVPGGSLPGVDIPRPVPPDDGARGGAAPGTFGGACDATAGCAGQTRCEADEPGGMCVGGGCEGREYGAFCDGDGPESGVCVRDAAGASCVPTCVMNADCREGYVCSATLGDTNAQGYGHCTAGCQFTGCDLGSTCMPTGACACDHEDEEMEQEVTRLDLGAVAVTRSSFEWLEFTVPADGVSMNVTLTPRDATIAPVFVRLTAPGGEVLHNYFEPEESAMKYAHTSREKAALMYPNAPSLELPAGTYQLQVGAAGSTTLDVEVFIKRGVGVDQGGRMPLNLWFTKTDYMSASKARTDAKFKAAMAQLKEIYAEAGIELTPITYHDVPEPLASRYAVVDGDMGADHITSKVLAGERKNGLNVVFVDQWIGSGGSITLGQASGVPGPPGRSDTRSLGVLVSMATTYSLGGSADKLAAIMAHEIGHYMGLFHTTEASGTNFDPLTDTAECPARLDANSDGNVSARECGADSNNLMFWQASTGQVEGDLTASQDWVLLRNVMVTP